MIVACSSAARRVTSGPAMTMVSLLASALFCPLRRRPKCPQAGMPTIAATTTSISASEAIFSTPAAPVSNSVPRGRLAMSIEAAASGSVTTIQRGLWSRACSASNFVLEFADSPQVRSLPWDAAMTSTPVPIDPVEPSTATLVTRSCMVMRLPTQGVVMAFGWTDHNRISKPLIYPSTVKW